ncbi:hypothetical protein RUND412_009998 [Rhizina undulata]
MSPTSPPPTSQDHTASSLPPPETPQYSSSPPKTPAPDDPTPASLEDDYLTPELLRQYHTHLQKLAQEAAQFADAFLPRRSSVASGQSNSGGNVDGSKTESGIAEVNAGNGKLTRFR